MSGIFKSGDRVRAATSEPGADHSMTLPRAKILRCGVQLEDNSEEMQQLLADLVPLAVVRGKVKLDKSLATPGVGLAYAPEQYGLAKVESVKEMQERHRSEVEHLKLELEQSEKAAYERGMTEGLAKGHDQGVEEVRDDFQKHIELLVQMTSSVAEQTRQYFVRVEERLVGFAMHIARRVVGEIAERDRQVAVKLAAEAIRHATDRVSIVLRCSPVDLESLKSAEGDLITLSEGIREIKIEPTPNVEPGGIVLETAGGSIDATIRTMLDELHDALLPEHPHSREEQE